MPTNESSSSGVQERKAGGDRRVRRTREALTAAFTDLALERRYQDIEINDVAKRADVGRSTLYAHFSGKDDLLAHSLDGHLSTIARCTLKSELQPDLVRVIEHFWQQRRMARAILDGAPAVAVTRLLACHLEAELLALDTVNRSKPAFPVLLASAQLASGILALLRIWLAGRAAAQPETVAKLLHSTTYAAAVAALRLE